MPATVRASTHSSSDGAWGACFKKWVASRPPIYERSVCAQSMTCPAPLTQSKRRAKRINRQARMPAAAPTASAIQSPNSAARPGTNRWCTSSIPPQVNAARNAKGALTPAKRRRMACTKNSPKCATLSRCGISSHEDPGGLGLEDSHQIPAAHRTAGAAHRNRGRSSRLMCTDPAESRSCAREPRQRFASSSFRT